MLKFRISVYEKYVSTKCVVLQSSRLQPRSFACPSPWFCTYSGIPNFPTLRSLMRVQFSHETTTMIHDLVFIKSLGVFIDSRLSFDKQVSGICRASYSNIKALRKIRPTLDLETAKTVACAIVPGWITVIPFCTEHRLQT